MAAPPPDLALLTGRVGHVDPGEEKRFGDTWLWLDRTLGAVARRLGAARGAPYHVALWPWQGDGVVYAFAWARFKRGDASRHATHLGLYIDAARASLLLDLERDPLEAGLSAERLADYVDYVRSLDGSDMNGAEIGTDPTNRMPLASFRGARDLDALLARNADRAHPWPKIGWWLEAGEAADLHRDLTAGLGERLTLLAPLYESALARYADRRRLLG